MTGTPERKEMKKKPKKTGESIASQEKSSSSEKEQVEQTETTKRFCDNIIDKVKNIEMGALFAGVESFLGSAKKIDSKITMRVKGVLSKVTRYFRTVVDSYNKTQV